MNVTTNHKVYKEMVIFHLELFTADLVEIAKGSKDIGYMTS